MANDVLSDADVGLGVELSDSDVGLEEPKPEKPTPTIPISTAQYVAGGGPMAGLAMLPPAPDIPRVEGTSTAGQIGAAGVNLLSSVYNAAKSPLGLGLAVTAPASPVIGALAGLGFGIPAIGKGLHKVYEYGAGVGNLQTGLEGAGETGLGALMTLGGAKGVSETLKQKGLTGAKDQIESTSRVPPEQQGVAPERPTESQAQAGTSQRGGEGEQPIPQPAEVSQAVEKAIQKQSDESQTPVQKEAVGPAIEKPKRFMLSPDKEILSQAKQDLENLPGLPKYHMTQAARGVVVGSPTILDGYFGKRFLQSPMLDFNKEQKATPDDIYNAFEPTRQLLRKKYGDTVTLWRAQGQGKSAKIEFGDEGKNTLNYASREGAKQYMDETGRQLTAKAIPVNDIIAVHSPNAKYEEFIVLNRESPDLSWTPEGRQKTPPSGVAGEAQPSAGPGGATMKSPVPAGDIPQAIKETTASGEKPQVGGEPMPQGPGAASVGDVPQASQLAQLTEAIGTQISPNKPLGERISTAVNIADKWAKGKDAVTQGIAKARAASQALIDSYVNLPKWTNFRDAIGKWTGADQKTALEVYKFQKQIMKAIPDRLRQEAITNWIQADGDEALLRSRAEASKPNVRRGYELALELTPAEKTLARNIGSYLDARLQEGLGAGLLKQGVDNYVTQVWKRSNNATKKLWADLFGVGTLNPNFKFARKRIFDSYFEGEQAGYTPKNKTIGNLVSQYDLAFNRALSARALIKRLQEGTAEDGKPITMTSGKTSIVSNPEDIPQAFLIKPNTAPEGAVSADGRPYRPIDHWALRDWKWATKGPNGEPVFVQGDMLVHPDHWKQLDNVLKTSRLRANPISGAILKGSALAKQTKLSISPFHTVQEGVHAAAHRVNPFSPGEIDLNNPIDKSLVDHGLMVMDPRSEELFAEGSSGGGLVGKIPGLGRLQQWYTEMTFKDYIPRLKMTMAKDALERNLAAYAKDIASGKVTKDQIIDLTARESNAAFGEQNYKMMGRSPNVQDVLRLGLLAPDFLEARFRFVGQALKPYGREQRIALALMFGALYTAARVMNKAGDDDYHWDKPFSVFYKGKEYRLRTLLGDVQHLITDPRSFWYNRLSPISRTVSEYITGRDDRGIKRSSAEQFMDFLSWFKPIPLQTRSDTTAVQQVLGAAGVPSKTYTKQQEVYELADKWMKNSTDPKVVERYNQIRQETLPDSPYRALRDALRKDDLKTAKAEYQKLRQTRNFGTISTAIKHNRPFTGSYASEQKFRASLTPDQRKVYDQAIKERRELYSKFLKAIHEP